MVKTVEQTAREAYQSEMDRIVAKATAKGAADAITKAEDAYNITMERDAKVNLARTDIALQNVRNEYEQQLTVLQQQTKAELDIELHNNIASFRSRVKGDIGPLDNVLLEEITKWAETRGYQLTEIDREAPPAKRADSTPGEGKKRRRAGEQRSRSSSIASFTAPPSPAAPVTPPMRAPIVTALMMDNNRTPTPTRTRNVELMDIEQSNVQQLQSGMEALHQRKEAANQTVAASLHAPANQMAVSPPKPVPATMAAESVISTRLPPARKPTPVDPMLAAIMSALDRIQSSVDSLDKRVKAVEKPTSRTRPTPAAAAVVSMPMQPSSSRPSNPVIDLKAKTTTPRLPKPTTLVPASPPPRVDDIQAFESYRDDYDADFPQAPAQRSAPSKAAQIKAAEWIEVKAQPNHRRGIINLDYATVARSEQSAIRRLRSLRHRTVPPRAVHRNVQRTAPQLTRRSLRSYETAARRVKQRRKLSAPSPRHSSFWLLAPRSSNLPNTPSFLSVDGGFQNSTRKATRGATATSILRQPEQSHTNKSCNFSMYSWSTSKSVPSSRPATGYGLSFDMSGLPTTSRT
jgi:hypothetical protein